MRDKRPRNHSDHLTRGRVKAPPSLIWGSLPFPGLHGPPSFRTWASASPAVLKSPQPTSALAAGPAGADPWPRGHGGGPGPRGSRASSRFTPRCSLVPSTRPQKRRHIPEESTNKWRQRVKTAMAGVKLVLFSFGGNASLDCVQTIQVRCVFPQQTLLYFFLTRFFAFLPHPSSCDVCRDVTAWLPWVCVGGDGSS